MSAIRGSGSGNKTDIRLIGRREPALSPEIMIDNLALADPLALVFDFSGANLSSVNG